MIGALRDTLHDPAYWAGMLTWPLGFMAFLAFLIARAWISWTLDERWGISFDAKFRDTSKISDYVLSQNIWWEKQRGPIFTGGWYRETYEPPKHGLATRWIGFGWATGGPCFMIYRKIDTGEVS